MSSKACKFGCGIVLTWDNGKRKFMEPDGTEHSKERCESLRSKASTNPQQPAATSQPAPALPTNTDPILQVARSIEHLAVAIESALQKERAGL